MSVGLAVFNGEELIGTAIEHILAQTFEDFELIICDNDSSDRTEEICRQFAARDPRIRYYRNPKNIGGVRNENRTYYLACGEFYKLAAHDDLISPDFLERCVAELDRLPEADVCVSSVDTIDEHGTVVATDNVIAGLDDTPHQRMRSLSAPEYFCEGIYGVIRVSALRRVRPQSNHMHSDRVVLCELAIPNRFAMARDALMSKRWHVGNTFVDWRARMAWFQPELKRTGRIKLPHWLQVFDYSTMLLRNPLPPIEWLRCWFEVGRWMHESWRSLVMDVLFAARMLAAGKAGRLRRYATEGRVTSTHAYHVAAADDRVVVGSLFITADSFDLRRDGQALLSELETAAAAGEDVALLALGGDRQGDKPFYDDIRRLGIPVMVPRPTRGGRRRRLRSLLAEVTYFVVASGADTVRVVSDDAATTKAARAVSTVTRKQFVTINLSAREPCVELGTA